MLKTSSSGVLSALKSSTYRMYWRQSAYPLACDRSERDKQSSVCTSSFFRLLRPCWKNVLSFLRDPPPTFHNIGRSLQLKHEGGFTLVEALLAIALLATLGAIVFGSLLTTTQVVDAGRAAAAREQTIRRVLRLMAEELAIGVKETTFPWVGLNGTQDGQSADTLAFVTRGDGLGVQAARESEILRVIYTREGDRLIRFVRRNLYGLTDESVDQVNLATKVKGFNVRYYSRQGQVWLDEWSSTGPLPTALLLEITFQETDAEPYTIREWVTVGVS